MPQADRQGLLVNEIYECCSLTVLFVPNETNPAVITYQLNNAWCRYTTPKWDALPPLIEICKLQKIIAKVIPPFEVTTENFHTYFTYQLKLIKNIHFL